MKKYGLILLSFLLMTNVHADYESSMEAIRSGDYLKAIQELTDLVEAENPKALYLMGYIYYNGTGLLKNDQTAYQYFQRAADLDDAGGLSYIGYFYDKGIVVESNPKKAIEYYERAVEYGDNTAMVNLGVMYALGRGVEQNYDKAFELLSKADTNESDIASLYLGHMYNNGQGVIKDQKKAVEYYQKSASAGNLDAHQMLGYLYHFGKGVAKNYDTAIRYYLVPAEQKRPEAQYNLASVYIDRGQKGDRELAHAWLTKAIDLGFEQAGPARDELEKVMSLREITSAKAKVSTLIEAEKKVEPVQESSTMNMVYSDIPTSKTVGTVGQSQSKSTRETVSRKRRRR